MSFSNFRNIDVNYGTVFIRGDTLDKTWFSLLWHLHHLGRPYQVDAGSFAGHQRLEFDFVAGTIQFPIQYTEGGVRLPLAVTVPPGVPAPTTDDAIEKYFTEYLMDTNLALNEHYRYATWLQGGEYLLPELKAFNMTIPDALVKVPNQVAWCINHYKKHGFANNHCCMTIGYPESNLAYDKQYDNEMERGTSPCLRVVDTKIINENGKNYLCMYVYFRSWDCYSGWPQNMGGLALLQEYMSSELGVQVGTLNFSAKGLHAYDFQLEAIKSRIGA